MIGVEYFGVSIPIIFIICITIIKLNKQNSMKTDHVNQQAMDELYYSIKEMKKRINNLETILYDREKRS